MPCPHTSETTIIESHCTKLEKNEKIETALLTRAFDKHITLPEKKSPDTDSLSHLSVNKTHTLNY